MSAIELRIFCEKRLSIPVTVPCRFPDSDPSTYSLDFLGDKFTTMPATRTIQWEHLSRSVLSWTPGCFDADTRDLIYFIETSPDVHAVLTDFILFKMLAGISNKRPHAPVPAKMGVPFDASEIVMDGAESGYEGRVEDGPYRFNWMTLREIDEFDWDRSIIRYAFVSPLEWYEHKTYGKGNHRRREVSGSNDIVIKQSKMDELVMAQNLDGIDESEIENMLNLKINGKRPYCVIEWEESYRSMADRFLNTVVTYLRTYSNGDPDSVRIIYWFF